MRYLAIRDDTYQLIEETAAAESRSPEAVVDEAVQSHVRSLSKGHRGYRDAARRFRTSPDGSEEKATAARELVDAIARETGVKVADRGGSVAAVRAYLRKHHEKAATSDS